MNQEEKLFDTPDPMTISSWSKGSHFDLETQLKINIGTYLAYKNNSILKYFLENSMEISNNIFTPVKYNILMNKTFFEHLLIDIGSYHGQTEGSLDNMAIVTGAVNKFIELLFRTDKWLVYQFYIILKDIHPKGEDAGYLYRKYVKSMTAPEQEDMSNLLSPHRTYKKIIDEIQELVLGEWRNISEKKDILLKILSDKTHRSIFTDLFDIHLIDIKDRLYSDLSSGEKDSIALLAMLNNCYKKITDKDIIVLLDESEAFYHPYWTTKFLATLINSTGNKQNVHFILTTHSPFILSDIPKENVIFLEKYNENDGEVKNNTQKIGNCKNVTRETNIETFGANIHTLLSHGFFMEDGLIGEYAKTKINEVIDYLNGKDSPIKDNEEAQKYINIIGEPILKRQLQKMLDSKRISRIDEIDELKKRIEFLEKQK